MGSVHELGPRLRNQERERFSRDTVGLKIPEDFNPHATRIQIFTSTDHPVKLNFWILQDDPKRPDEPTIVGTQENIRDALLTGKDVGVGFNIQHTGDILRIVYSQEQLPDLTIDIPTPVEQTFRRTKKGWEIQPYAGSFEFVAKDGPEVTPRKD